MTLSELLHELRALDVQLSLDNGELRIRAPKGVVTDPLKAELKRQKADLIAMLQKSAAGAHTAIPRTARTEEIPLSAAQRRLWFLEQIRGEGPSAYNIAAAFVVDGVLNADALASAVGDLLARHEVLRTGVRSRSGEPHGFLAAAAPIAIDAADLSARADADAAFQLEASALANAPFDLAAPPLIRVAIRRLNAARSGCLVVVHHIVADGESMPVLMHDLAACYAARVQHHDAGLPPLRIQYADAAAWQNAQSEEQHLAFWKQQFAELPEPIELPTDFTRPLHQSFGGDVVSARIDAQTVAALASAARTSGASVFMALLAATSSLLQRWTNQDDITIGTPARGRPHPDLEGQVGCYVNTLALRCRIDRRESFTALLSRVRATVTEAFDHESYPFDRLIDRLSVRRDTGRSPLFDVMLSFAPASAPALELDGVKATAIDLGQSVSQLDLTFNFAPAADGGLDISLQFRTDLFTRARMERLAAHLTSWISAVASNPSAPLREHTTLSADERAQVLRSFNDTAAPYSTTATLISKFIEQTARTPKAIAVVDGDRSWTYAEIDARSSAVAAALIKRGVRIESRVAVLTLRGERMMTGLLGVLKAGAAYVPIQPTDPQLRIESLIADCAPQVVITEADIASWSDAAASSNAPAVQPANAAYVIYTSGSTGKPKGVVIQHGSVVNRLEWMDRAYPLRAGDVILQKTPYTFDVSVWELFWWSFAGATVAFLEPDAEKDPSAIVAAIAKHRVTTMHFVPSMLRTFLEHVEREGIERLKSLRNVFASGEALPADLVAKFNDLLGRSGTTLHNLYGPTEATVDVSFFDCARLGANQRVPIGAPVANTQLYVLDRDLQPAPLGVSGEIFIGGVNVGRGYLNRADLTADRFMPDPFAGAGARMYRTGDIGQWRVDDDNVGQLEYLGRNDHQVKIRGNRIELGEIEAVLLSHPDIRNAAVMVHGDVLVAFVMSDSPLALSPLRAFLAERVPAYFVPSQFVMLDTWPLTSSGKLDRKALPSPETSALRSTRAGVELRTDTERALAAVYSAVLNAASIGADDDFFERGGHSLLAARVVAHARQEHGLDISLRDVFAHPTVAALAALADQREPFRDLPLRPVPVQPHYPVSHAQRRLWLAEQRVENAGAYNVAVAFTVSGPLDVAALTDAWQRLQQRHESLRTAFRVVAGEARQVVADAPDVQIDVADLRSGSFADEAARIAAVPFDLTQAPLVRMAVRRLPNGEHGWVVVMHHIVCDGWSMPILVRELASLYEDSLTQRASTLAPLRVQYKDYAVWQRALVDGAAIEPHRRYWHALFPSAPPRLQLSFDSGAPAGRPTTVDRATVTLNNVVTANLRELGRAHGASLFMTLLASVNALLYRFSGQNDITVGTVTAGRIHPDVERQIGFYVNTLALRSPVDGGKSFAAFLEDTRDRTLEAFDHQAYPFDRLVDDLNLPADGRFPLFDVMVVLQNNETAELKLPHLTLAPVELPASGNKFDLSFHFAEAAHDELELTLEFRSDRFDRGAIERMSAEFTNLVSAVLTSPQRTLDALPLPADAIQRQTLAVVSTFTAEPIEEPLAFWMDRLGTPSTIAFAPFGQVFQQLLDPSSLIGRNKHGANICLLRLSDWERPLHTPTVQGDRAAFADHDTHVLPNGAEVAHLNSYETEDVFQEIFVDRVYGRHGVSINDGDVVFDIGANIGLFSLFASSSAKNIRLFGFEPAPPTFEALRRNMAVYAPSAKVFNCGIGAQEGAAPFTFYPKSSVFSSYHPDEAEDTAAIRAVVRNVVEREAGGSSAAVVAATDEFMTGRLETQTAIVPIRTLESIIREQKIDRIDLLKLDAEKSERGILSGLSNDDWQKIQQIVIEVHDSDGETLKFCSDLVTSHGFNTIVEEEARLQESGLYTVYGRRPGAPSSSDADAARNIDLFCSAAKAVVERAPSVPFVVIACPEVGAQPSSSEPLLAERIAAVPGVSFVPSAELARLYPVNVVHDSRADALGAVPYTADMYAALATMAVRRIEGARRPPFKVVVLDADNTLWRGVVGEDGVEGISIGEPQRALQAFMLEQRRGGMLLCLCSKNADEDVVRAFEHHASMPLKLADFAARRVNWQPKSENIRAMAEQLSLGVDSFIFVDDNPLECAEVQANCPGVATLCVQDPAQISDLLRGAWAFDRAAATAEDAKRAEFYAASTGREELRSTASDLGSFIDSLNLTIDIAAAASADIPRTAQLTQRTNQFNTTTLRRSETEVASLNRSGHAFSVVRVSDRFGDYGLVGVVSAVKHGGTLLADAMMLSCRALGRGVEHRMVAHLGDAASRAQLAFVDIAFAPTPKNKPAQDFLDSIGADVIRGKDDARVYRLSTAAAMATTFNPNARVAADIKDDAAAKPAGIAPRRRRDPESQLVTMPAIAGAIADWNRAHGTAGAKTRRSSIAAPTTEVERDLSSIWADVLGVSGIGINESFFELGGHSLKAIRMLSKASQLLGAELTLSDLFADPTIAGLASRAAARPSAFEAIPAAPTAADYPLSGAQRRLWILGEMGGDGTVAYNVPAAFVLSGDLDTAALESAFRRLIARHESLRTRFIVVNGEPRQEILADAPFALQRHDTAVTEAAFVDAAQKLAHEPLSFAEAPLLRASLWPLDDHRWGLAIVIHHVVTDGWSMPIVVRELFAFYDDARAGRETTMAPLRVHYKDYAVWQQALLSSSAGDGHRDYWRAQFADAPPAIDLPSDGVRPPVQSFRGDSVARHLDASLASAVNRLAHQHGATVFMTLLAALDVLLYRYTGESDVTVGAPMTGREHPDLAEQVGFYVNTLALRNTLAPDESFASLLDRVRANAQTAFSHQAYPFDRLVEELRLPRNMGRSPLFDIMLVVEQDDSAKLSLPEIDVRPVSVRHDISRFDLTFHVVASANGLDLGVQFSTDLFSRARVEAMCRHFEALLTSIANDASMAVADLPISPAAERAAILNDFSVGAVVERPRSSLVDLFREQAARKPSAIALVPQTGDALSYRQLDEQSDRIAVSLLSRGLKPEDIVGVQAPRSAFTFAAMLGVMKAGGAYLPLDPSLPQARLDFMIATAGASIVLTEADFTPDLKVAGSGVSDRSLARVHADQLAYVIFTSGSTGQPKGVGVSHAALANMALDQIRSFELASGDVLAQFSSVGFDASIYETFLALLSGAPLAIVPDEARVDTQTFAAWTDRTRATAFVLPPAFVRTLDRARIPSARLLITAGEAADSGDANHYASELRYVNAYGPTEFAVCATGWRVVDHEAGDIPIGRPIANASTYVLDQRGELCPVGVPGELYLSGAGLARGYVSRADLTADRFVPDPFALVAGARMYKTGDLACWRADGALMFLGRNDAQVKVRGHRIELGEVEAALRAHASVRDAVVAARALDLVAYVTGASDLAIDTAALKPHLRQRLPEYMIPSHIVYLDALPVTTSGKVDRRALPEPVVQRAANDDQPPATDVEKQIAAVWCDVLGVSRVGALDSFFDLGGNSILLARVLSALRKDIAPALTLLDLFTYPRVRDLAQHLSPSNVAKDADASARTADRAAKQREALARARKPRP